VSQVVKCIVCRGIAVKLVGAVIAVGDTRFGGSQVYCTPWCDVHGEGIGGGRVTVVEEPLYAGANGALQLAVDMPGEYWQQLR